MRKNICSILLSASLICGMMPVEGMGLTALAAEKSRDTFSILLSQNRKISGAGWEFHEETHTLTITDGEVVSKDYESLDSVPWHDYGEEITDVKLGQGVTLTKVGAFAFMNVQMEHFALPDTVAEIGENAFNGCKKWKDEIHLTIKKIGRCAFGKCGELKGTVQFAPGVTELPEYIFSGCKSLERIELPKYVSLMGDGVLRDCVGLTEINIPATLKKLPSGFIQGCVGITEIEIPETVTQIGFCAFAESGITTLEIPASVKKIGYAAFLRNTCLKKIIIPDTVEQVEGGLFDGCSELEYVEFQKSDYTESTLKKFGAECNGVYIDAMFRGAEKAVCICDGSTYETLLNYQNIYRPEVWGSEDSFNSFADKGWKGVVYKPDELMKAYKTVAEEAAELKESDYDAALWADFRKVLAESAVLADTGETTYEKVMNQRQAKRDILAGVKAFLRSTWDEANALLESDYDTEVNSWWDYQDALDDAAKILDSDTVDTVEEIVMADRQLKIAMNQLEILSTEEAEKALDKVIAATKGLKQADYSPKSWKALQDAIHAAENIKVVGTISQIEEAGKKIQAAVKALEKVPATSGKSNTTVKKPTVGKATLKKVASSKKKTLLVKWKKVSAATGYHIQMATNKKMTKGKKIYTVKKSKTTQKTIKKLKSKKKYYVRIRAYRRVNGKTYSGKWSAIKKVKIK